MTYAPHACQRRLAPALKALGLCVFELGEAANSIDGAFRLPHPITHGECSGSTALSGVCTVPQRACFPQALQLDFLPPTPTPSPLPYAPPHPAAGGERVGDLSVSPGKDAPWTRAMKLLLTDLKWLLAWSSRLPE